MKSWEERAKLIRETDDIELLKELLCPFFEKGGSPECRACRKEFTDIEDCRQFYLERIYDNPSEVWTARFDPIVVLKRSDKVDITTEAGVGIICDNCYMASKCSKYAKNHECAFNWVSGRPKTPDDFYEYMLTLQYERVQRASAIEKIDGGVPDMNLSTEMDRLSGLVNAKSGANRSKFSMHIEAEGSGGEEKSAGGILSKIFGSPTQQKALPEAKEMETIDAEVIEEPVVIKRKKPMPKLKRYED